MMEVYTIATGGYVPFILNLHASAARIGLADRLTVYSLDDRAHHGLTRAGVRSVRYGTGPGRQWTDWRTLDFMRTMSYKYAVALDQLKAGRRALYIDGDIVFLRDPLPYLESLVDRSSAELVLQYQSPKQAYGAGFWVATPTPAVISLFEDLWTALQSADYTDDEDTLNSRLKRGCGVTPTPLDVDLFPCGNRFLVSREKRRTFPDGQEPFDRDAAYILHFTHVIGRDAKVAAMVKHGAAFHDSIHRLHHPPAWTWPIRKVRAAGLLLGRVRRLLAGHTPTAWPRLVAERLAARLGLRGSR